MESQHFSYEKVTQDAGLSTLLCITFMDKLIINAKLRTKPLFTKT